MKIPLTVLFLMLVTVSGIDVAMISLMQRSEKADTEMQMIQAQQLAHWQRWSAIYSNVQGAMAEIGLGSLGVTGIYFDADGQRYFIDESRRVSWAWVVMCNPDIPRCPPGDAIPTAQQQGGAEWAPEKEASVI